MEITQFSTNYFEQLKQSLREIAKNNFIDEMHIKAVTTNLQYVVSFYSVQSLTFMIYYIEKLQKKSNASSEILQSVLHQIKISAQEKLGAMPKHIANNLLADLAKNSIKQTPFNELSFEIDCGPERIREDCLAVWRKCTNWIFDYEIPYLEKLQRIFPNACFMANNSQFPLDPDFGPLLAIHRSGDILLVINKLNNNYEFVSNGWVKTHKRVARSWMDKNTFEKLPRLSRNTFLFAMENK